MNILVVLGWWNESAVDAISNLGLLNTSELSLDYIDTLRDNIRNINDEYNVKMRWVMRRSHADDDQILVWRDILSHTYESLDDDPIANFIISPNDLNKAIDDFNKFTSKLLVTCLPPSVLVLTDMSELVCNSSSDE